MKICASCGASLPDGAKFCVGCGSTNFKSEEISSEQPYNQQYGQSVQTQYNQYGQPVQTQYKHYGQPVQTQYDQYGQPVQPQYNQYEQPYTEQPTQPQYAEQPQQTASVTVDKVEQPKADPYEESKNFKFEKKEKAEAQADSEDTQQKPTSKNLKDIINSLMDTTDHSHEFDRQDAEKNKVTSIIACFGITFWVPFVFSSNSRFSRFYANQGLLILILSLPFIVVNAIFTSIINSACIMYTSSGPTLSILGYILDILLFGIFYLFPIFIIFTTIQNIRAGKAKDIPLIGKFRLIR